MIIMTKLEKRLKKLQKHPDNALVIGSGFDDFEACLKTYRTVFLVTLGPRKFRAKNLIYREDLVGVEHLTDISVILIDLDHLSIIEPLASFLNKCHPIILVQGNDVIPQKYSRVFYERGWRAIDQSKIFHVWKKLH